MTRCITIALLVLGLAAAVRADNLSAVQELAEAGDVRAQFVLGTLHRYGQGVARDNEEMLRWWRKAAEGGYSDAQFALGDLYSGGYDVPQDNVRAYMWFDILATQARQRLIGPVAVSNRDAVAAVMTPADTAMAKRLSAEWQARYAKQ